MNFFKRIVFVFLFMLPLYNVSYGQVSEITGTITEETGQPLIGASVVLLRPGDSILVAGNTTDLAGGFRLEKIPYGNYLLKISYLGYAHIFQTIQITTPFYSTGITKLKNKTRDIGEILIEGKIPLATQQGDTSQFNANAFKTNPDANAEDLITKMPGITMQEGKVQAQGEEVKTVLVDGRPFFGDDPNSVLKNLPAELIESIQVFDRKSDQSLFTGIDDGNTTKTINVVTRQEFRNGTFGRLYGGYGYEDRYKAGATVNFFRDKRRITLLVQSNNINEQNFSMDDLAGVLSSQGGNNRGGGQPGNHSGGGGYRGPGGNRGPGGQGNDAGFFLVNQNNGINTTHAIGLNYANRWKKVEIAGSYFFNATDNQSNSDLYRQYSVSSSEGLVYNEQKFSESGNINHRVNLKIDYKIDSMRTILVQPKFTGQFNHSTSDVSGLLNLKTVSINETDIQTSAQLTVMNFSSPILFRNSFRKKGRTFSLNLTPTYNIYTGEGYLFSYADTFIDSLKTDSIDQYSTTEKKGFTIGSNLTYTEPLSETLLININYINTYNQHHADKETYDHTPDTPDYLDLNNLLTNNFRYDYFSHNIGAGIRLQKNKVNFSIGAGYQWAVAKNNQAAPYQFSNATLYSSFLPNAMFMYKFTEKKNLRLYYRSFNSVPSIEQIQPVINNNNPLQLTTGNPYLKQDWQHNINLRYSTVDASKNKSLFFFVNFNYTKDYMGNSTIVATKFQQVVDNYILQEGAQITQPVNFDEAYSIRSFLNYSFAWSSLKSNINLNTGLGYSKTPGLNNGTLNYAGVTSPFLGISITSNINKRIDFTISSNTSFTQITNTTLTQLNSGYLNQSSKVRVNLMPWKGLVIQSEISHQYYAGLSDEYNEKFFLWNGGIGYKFLKNQVAELRLSVYDILEQNKSVTRNTTETYYEDIKTNVLNRYIMVTFTYNLKFFKELTLKK